MLGSEVFEPGLGYHLVLALHILGLALWIGGLLHAAVSTRSEARGVLLRAAHPGAAFTILTGLTLAFQGGWLARGWWLYAKIFLVLMLIPVTLFLKRASESEQGDPKAPLADFAFKCVLYLIVTMILLLSIHKFL